MENTYVGVGYWITITLEGYTPPIVNDAVMDEANDDEAQKQNKSKATDGSSKVQPKNDIPSIPK
jgi:hypothetical protein